MTIRELQTAINAVAKKNLIGGYVSAQERQFDFWLRNYCPHQDMFETKPAPGCGNFAEVYVDGICVGKFWRQESTIKPAPIVFILRVDGLFDGLEDMEIGVAVNQAKIRTITKQIDEIAAENRLLKDKIANNEAVIGDLQNEVIKLNAKILEEAA